MEKRTMTVARGLTRLKTIKAQLSHIADQIGRYGAISNKSRSSLGDQHADLPTNHKRAIEEINSLYQKFEDLKNEMVKIKLAIDKSNIVTEIVIADKVMTVQEALIYKRDVQAYVGGLTSQYGRSVSAAQLQADQHNRTINTKDMDPATAAAVLAEVIYLVPKKKVDDLNKFQVEFLTELDGTLNESNALTQIEVD